MGSSVKDNNMTITHAAIIPLIGGFPVGTEKAFGTPPEFVISYKPFASNDSHYRNYRPDVPFYLLDEENNGFNKDTMRADVIVSTCPCAGLSQLSGAASSDNPANQWMLDTTRYLLEEYRPQVYAGENAPALAGKIGKGVRDQMYKMAKDNGYTMTLYRTKSRLHNNVQVRERSFFFFWKGDKVPILNYYNNVGPRIEDLLRGVKSNFQTEVINKQIPSQNPYYRFVLEEIYGGITHREFSNNHMSFHGTGNIDIQSFIESKGYTYDTVAAWMEKNGLENEVKKCLHKFEKLKAGKNIMRRGLMVPFNYIGAFVSHYPLMLTHPDEDRYLNYREAMTIMGLPDDFELLGGRKNVNHICQNVPVQTAADMATEIKEALEGRREWVKAGQIFQYNHSQKHELFDVEDSKLDNFFS